VVGVSPAYFVSRFGDRFGPQDISASLTEVARLGAEGYQLELFWEDDAPRWTDAAVDAIRNSEQRSGVRATQFVAHYLHAAFASPEALAGIWGEATLLRFADIAARFPTVSTVTVPLPSFDPGRSVDREAWTRIEGDFLAKLRRCAAVLRDRGLRLALELIPGNLLGGYRAIGTLRRTKGLEDIGACLDTGLAQAARDCVELLPAALGPAVYATHLKDSRAGELLSLEPGKGDLPWGRFLGSLPASRYRGSYDVEFLCPAAEADAAYGRAIEFVKAALRATGAEGVAS
jgi:sugar phosphate isomerase/epimerase